MNPVFSLVPPHGATRQHADRLAVRRLVSHHRPTERAFCFGRDPVSKIGTINVHFLKVFSLYTTESQTLAFTSGAWADCEVYMVMEHTDWLWRMNNVELSRNCSDCDAWEKSYETATLTFFRLQGQFRVASLTANVETTQRLSLEVDQAAARKHELREAGRKHWDTVHDTIRSTDHEIGCAANRSGERVDSPDIATYALESGTSRSG